MDWYFGSGMNDFLVPEDEEVYDRLPSPRSWSKWCLGASESHEFYNKRLVMESKSAEGELEFNDENLSSGIPLGNSDNGKDQSSGISMSERLSEEFLPQTALSCDRPDYQPDDLAGNEELDELFLSSFLEDLPRNESLHNSFCFFPETEHGMVSQVNHLTDMILQLQCLSYDTLGTGSSKYLKAHAFSPSESWEKGQVATSLFNPRNSEQKNWALAKTSLVNMLVPFENDCTNELVVKEISLQQSVLEELELVMEQLTEKTRICFRDALYRLASNSRQHIVKWNQNGDLSVKTPWTGGDEEMRLEEKKSTELQTNIIDRAIANLMFSKMDLNVRDFPVPTPVLSKRGIAREIKPSNCSWNQPQVHNLPSCSSFQGDAEVPILDQKCPQTSKSGQTMKESLKEVFIS